MSEWLESLPTELQDNAVLKRFESVEALATNAVENEAYRGNSIRIPSEDADAEQRTKTAAKIAKHFPDLLQRPDPDKGYLEQGEDFHQMFGVPAEYAAPEGVTMPDDAMQAFNEMAKAAKLNKDQYAVMSAAIASNLEQAGTQNADGITANQAALDKSWGMAAPERRASADALVQQFQDPEDPLGQLNSAAYKMLHNVVKAFGGKMNGMDVGKATKLDSPGEAKAKHSDLRASKEWQDMMGGTGNISASRKKELIERDIDLRRASAA